MDRMTPNGACRLCQIAVIRSFLRRGGRNAAISRHFERDPIPYALETDWLAGAGGFEPLHFGIRSAAVDHGLRPSLGMRCGTTTSIEMRTFQCSRPERRVFANSDSAMQRFEYCRPSQPVRINDARMLADA